MFFAHRKLQSRIDLDAVRAAITAAEHQTSGEIRVSIARFFWGDVHAAAERAFTRLGMTRTPHRNGVLIFVVPARRRFTVLGDEGIHAHVGQQFWHDVTAAIADRFRLHDYTGGLLHGIETIGRELAEAFPYDPTAGPDTLPDEIDLA